MTRSLPLRPNGRIFLVLMRHFSFSCGNPARPRPGENTVWYKVFVHWELKWLNFLTDSVLIYIKHVQGWTLAFPADQENNFLDCSYMYSCSLIYACNNKEERTKAMLYILVSIVLPQIICYLSSKHIQYGSINNIIIFNFFSTCLS